MSFRLLAAAALADGRPVALVGGMAEAVEPFAGVATALGARVARIEASDVVADRVARIQPGRSGTVVLVTGCAAVDAGEEDALLDLAFDGHASLPADATVVLCFDDATPLSEALADDAVPCALLSPDMEAPSVAERVAAVLGGTDAPEALRLAA